jgi:hypothetical protein
MTESEAAETEQGVQRHNESQKEKMVRFLYWGTFLGLSLFGAFAAVGFYSSVMDIIDIWISSDFEPVFRMLFNLMVVLIALLGLSTLVRRLDIPFGESDGS